MLKFFRNIRRRLLDSGSLQKYLVYATGEIILVVIGILIALQINNWNVNRVNNRESNQFNNRLLTEINQNIDLSNGRIQRIDTMINSTREILRLFNEKSPNTPISEMLDSLIYLSIQGVSSGFSTGTLSEGLNTGKVALINSDELKSKLYGLDAAIGNVSNVDDIYRKYLNEIVQPFLYDHYNYRKMDSKYAGYTLDTSKFNYNHHKILLENEKFENIMDNHFYQLNSQLKFHEILRNEFEEIEKLIKMELHQ